MFDPSLEEALTKNRNPQNLIVHEGFVLDENVKTLVTKAIVPTRKYFSVFDMQHILAERLRKTGRLYVLIENRGTSKPEYRRVTQVDGRVLVLDQALNFTPQEGACVQLLLGMEWKYVDERELYKQDKEESRYRWV